jgi:hypothetical protein
MAGITFFALTSLISRWRPSETNFRFMRKLAFALLLITTVACSQQGEKVNSTIFLPGKQLAEIKNDKLDELSGLAASVNNPGLLWTLNDSGNKSEIYLVDNQLNIKLTCKLEGAKNRDWEDIAIGPGPEPGKTYVYVGDVGDNLKAFQHKRIFRFEEPVLGADNSIKISNVDKIVFELEGEKKDSEAIMINPKNKNLYILSKEKAPCFLYELKYPYSTTDSLVAKKIVPIAVSIVCAADFAKNGKEMLIKNYKNVYYWKIKNDSIALALRERPYVVEYKKEPQGESICFAGDGSGYYTISEVVRGEKSYLTFYSRNHISKK